MQRRPALVAGCLAVAMGAASCGGGADESARATPAPVAGTPAATASPSPTETPSETPTPSLSATPEDEGLIGSGSLASGEGGLGEGRVRFTVDELRRSGDTVVLNASLTRVDTGSSPLPVGDALSDGRTGEGDPADTFDGISMIDPVGRRRYLVARDSTGACVCSIRLDDALVSRESPVSLQATLTAPPAGVSTIDLSVPGIETFTSVSLEG